MEIVSPDASHIPGLRQLWKLSFGDADAFLDAFFESAFAPERCRCIVEDSVTAALYWFDCSCNGRKMAYLYAVATHPDHRGKGLCRQLMADTHAFLRERDYGAALLVPQDTGLRHMYAAMGYRNATSVSEFSCEAGVPVPLKEVDAEEYAVLRRKYLPENGVVQEGANLRFLHTYAKFYAGERFLAAVSETHIVELLGDRDAASGLLAALNTASGTVRMPGNESPFAMFYPLKENVTMPSYFGIAFD